LIDLPAPPVNDRWVSRALLGSAVPARLGPQKNWPRPAIVAAAITTWAILMIRLTVTQIHTGTRLPARIGT
jgi:hypothetical protein